MRRLAIAAVFIASCWNVAEAQSWDSGGSLRVGAFGQAARVEDDISGLSSFGTPVSYFSSKLGWGGGIVAGYDLRLTGAWLAGLEVDGSLDSARGRVVTGQGWNSDYFATVRARLGYKLSSAMLIYGTGGYAMHGVEYRGLGGTNTLPAKSSGTLGGWVAGGGVEYDFGDFTMFTELLHSEYGTWGFTAPEVPISYRVNDTANLVRVGVKFKIGYDYDSDPYVRRGRGY